MSQCEYTQRAGAYHDGELPDQQARQFEAHAASCQRCRTELARLEALSGVFETVELPHMSPFAVSRVRSMVVRRSERGIVRLAEALTAVAAAVLVVCGLWLWKAEASPASVGYTPAEWETLAIGPSTDTQEIGTELQVAQWMVDGLSGGDFNE